MTTDFARAALAQEIVRYAQVWEDCDVLRRALAVGPGDDVLSIGSAGDNVLALLLDDPRSITALDLNPAQAALIELKLAAYRALGWEELVCLVGARDGHDRLDLYDRVRPLLSRRARRFWDQRLFDIAVGVMHTGRLERYFDGFRRHHLPSLVPVAAVRALLALDDRKAQRALFARYFDTDAFRAVFANYFGRDTIAREGRDPSQFRWVEDVDVTAMLWTRFRYACTELPARGNFYLEYFLTGGYRDLEAGPPHLRPDAFETLRARVDRVEIVTEELGGHLDAVEPGRYSKANLSDLFEYLSPEDSEALFVALGEAMRPGGHIAYWNLFVPRAPAKDSRARLRSYPATADALWRDDRAFFYRSFHLEEVLP
jgi:S-adenosylmethionine-diacylglycerol 3-amino-3-carboxypropyl transferase